MAEQVKVERELALEAAELTSCDPHTSVVLCETFLYEPDVGEKSLGSLFLVAETVNLPVILGERPTARHGERDMRLDDEEPSTGRSVIGTIASALREEHYRDTSRDLLRSFEAALSAANAALASYAGRGESDWIENLHAAVGTFQGTTLHVARAGAAEILLARHGHLTDIGEGLSDPAVRHPQHAFTTIASGTISEHDALVLASPQFLQIVPRDRLGTFLTGKSSKETAMYVRDLLAETADRTPLAALFLRATRAPIALPAPSTVYGFPRRRPTSEPHQDRAQNRGAMAGSREDGGSTFSPDRPGRGLKAPLNLALSFRRPARYVRPTTPMRVLAILKRTGALLLHVVTARALPTVTRTVKFGSALVGNTLGKTAGAVRTRVLRRTPGASQESDTPRLMVEASPGPRPSSAPAFAARMRSTLNGLPASTKIFFLTTLIFVVLFAGSLVFLKRKRAEDAAIRAASERLEEARTKKQSADAALIYGNADEARALLASAREQAFEVERTPYYDEQVVDLLQRIQEVEDTTERVTRVLEPARVGDFGSVVPSGQTLGLQVIGAHLYAFSPETNAILRLAVDNGETSVVSQTSSGIGYFRNAAPLAAEKMLLFTTDSPGLALFDTARGDLIKQDVSGLPEGTKEITSLATFGSRLYLLLPEHRQIYGFSKTLAGYQGGAPWVKDEQVPVERAVSMGVDGYIYLLTSDGKIVKLLKGSPVEFSQSALTRPLEAPTRLVVNETLKHLYVLDPPQKRVVVYDTTGELTGQFLFPNAQDLRDISIGGKEETLYVLDGTAVYRVPLK